MKDIFEQIKVIFMSIRNVLVTEDEADISRNDTN